MNPIWQVYLHGNMSDQGAPEPTSRNRKKRQAQREKLQKEKEQRRAEAVERDIERYKVDHEGHEGDHREPETPPIEHEESAAERFQKELCWCIQQLEKGLQNLKPNAKQAEEAKKLLRTLKSPRAPMAKKRQVMRMTFGDYRTKMQREEKKNAAAMKKTFLTQATADNQNKSTFYRRSTSAAVSPRLSSGCGPPGGSELSTVPEADSSEESITSLENKAHNMTLSEDDVKQGAIAADSEKSPTKDDFSHATPSCSQADYDNLSLRSSPSGASTSSSASYHPPMLHVGQLQVDPKQSSDSTDSDQKDYPAVTVLQTSFCFNFEIEPDNIDQGPPAKRKPGKVNPSAKQAKDDTGSSEGSPKIGDLDKKGQKKGKRRKSKKKQQEKSEAVVVDNIQTDKQEVSSSTENIQVESQVVTEGSGEFKFNFPEPTPT